MKKRIHKLGKATRTARGFPIIKFKDYYGSECSLQVSSIAIYERPGTSALWFGPDDPDPKVLHGDAAKVGIKTDATCGWVPYPLPPEVHCSTRAHLDRKQVAGLITRLEEWLKTGTFK